MNTLKDKLKSIFSELTLFTTLLSITLIFNLISGNSVTASIVISSFIILNNVIGAFNRAQENHSIEESLNSKFEQLEVKVNALNTKDTLNTIASQLKR